MGHKGSCWTLIMFSLKIINFEHFAQASATTIFFNQNLHVTCSKFKFQIPRFKFQIAYVISSIWYFPLPFWLCSFAIVSSYCFTSEIQELMFLSQTLTTSWNLIQFPVAYLGRLFVNGGSKLPVILPFMITKGSLTRRTTTMIVNVTVLTATAITLSNSNNKNNNSIKQAL